MVTRKVMLVASSGREYMVSLTSVGDFHTEPPFIVWEQDDGVLFTYGDEGQVKDRYSSMQHFATEHGMVAGDFVSADPVN